MGMVAQFSLYLFLLLILLIKFIDIYIYIMIRFERKKIKIIYLISIRFINIWKIKIYLLNRRISIENGNPQSSIFSS
jgi:hypothetical protein